MLATLIMTPEVLGALALGALVVVFSAWRACVRAGEAQRRADELRAEVIRLGQRLALLERAGVASAPRPVLQEGPGSGHAAAEVEPPLPTASAAVAPPSAVAGASEVEAAVGLTWATRVGAVTLLAGLVVFFKVAVTEGWLGPLGRTLAGAGAGLGLVALAEALRTRVDARWRDVAAGSGLAILLVTVWAAHAWYGLLPAAPALAAFAAVVLLGAAVAWRHQSEPLLTTALAAGLANPLLLPGTAARPDGPSGLLLVLWMVPLTAGALALAHRRGWAWAAALATVGGAALVASWTHRAPADALAAPLAAGAVLALSVAAAGRRWPGSPAFREAILAAAPLVAVLAAGLALIPWPTAVAGALGGVLALASFGFYRAGRPDLTAPATAVAALLVLTAPAPGAPWLALLWAAPPWAAALAAALHPTSPPAWRSQALAWALALPSLGLGALACLAPTADIPLLTGAAVANLAAAALLVRRGHLEAAGVTLTLASVGAAAAILFGLDGVALPLAWSALGAALALAGRRTALRPALASAVALVGLALAHLLVFDFWSVAGLVPLGERALVLLATGAATLTLARAVRRPSPFATPSGSFGLALALGHTLLAGAAIVLVTRQLAPAALPSGDALLAALGPPPGATRAGAVATLVMGLYGAFLLAAGFVTRTAHRRWVGLAVLAVTLVKLALVDIWSLTRVEQMVVLLAVGALLLACGLLYARHAERIRRLLAGD